MHINITADPQNSLANKLPSYEMQKCLHWHVSHSYCSRVNIIFENCINHIVWYQYKQQLPSEHPSLARLLLYISVPLGILLLQLVGVACMLLLPQFELATFLLIGATRVFVEITCALFPLKPSIDCWYVFILCRTFNHFTWQ